MFLENVEFEEYMCEKCRDIGISIIKIVCEDMEMPKRELTEAHNYFLFGYAWAQPKYRLEEEGTIHFKVAERKLCESEIAEIIRKIFMENAIEVRIILEKILKETLKIK